MNELVRRVATGLGGATLTIAGWWTVTTVSGVSVFFLPGPVDVAAAFADRGPYLTTQATSTLGHMLAGFAAASTTAVMLAGVLGSCRTVQEAVFPMLVAAQAVPKVAVAPLLIVWCGFGSVSKIVLVGLLCFFPVLLATLTGLSRTPVEVSEYAASLAASRWSTFWLIRVRYAVPHMFVGLKLGLTLSLIGAVVAEITTPNSGLGAVIVRAKQSADIPLAFAAITMLAAIGVGCFYLLAGVERVAVPWIRHTTG